MSELPVIRLRPKSKPQAIRHGFPWVFADEVVLDRRTKGITPGDFAILEDAERKPLALVTVNPNSKIVARVMDLDVEARVNAAWLERRIARALAMRERMHDQPFYRLVHAEADGLPGLVIDRFGDAAVMQPNAAWADALADRIADALVEIVGVGTVVLNGQGRARGLEGLPERMEVVRGTTPEAPIPVQMNGATYLADLMGGQKTGLFLDQRPNHAFAQRLVDQGEVLDVFSHVGGFGLAMLAAGAERATCVDASAPALELAKGGADAMGAADRLEVLRGDAFAMLEQLAEDGRRFDVVICDPPAFAPSKPALEAGLRAYERIAKLAAPLVKPGGYLGLCSCSHAVDLASFRNVSARGIGRGGRRGQLIHSGHAGPDHPTLPQLAETGYLKSLFFRLD
ncbi:class I SAM-dependent rRNA methyltransferase [Paracoccus sp. 1_MG-2023]|uniref:RSP_2647 family RNA methyltransferase n=1 Tax=unclassified Paracoccus (in: a-proteobacteria) TaxID=2688777 RepID=UPI001C0897AF|nr:MULTISPECIES: class I SAM-dependent rRNA methyltransferase [unclassified Paracoccus (in: a-proteobacteria)]MBU2958502.1 class I SAM-dependent rRNA methyltransferase [Paracoccus sp. C2R09]MDO6668513.1 class I SAM-dependent rRNA methyltransferase [Paracoccus sp. 1_MG-2023]